jgi:hypothetical protein
MIHCEKNLLTWTVIPIICIDIASPCPSPKMGRVRVYCQAQPKPQFNWAELALLSKFDLNLLILLRFFTRESIGLYHFALKLNQISFLALVHECLPNGSNP